MTQKNKGCLVCNCEKTMPLDASKLSKALGDELDTIHTHLCRSELSKFESALKGDEPLVVACTQEAPLFQEIAEGQGKENLLTFVNIRENAGWSKDAGKANAKIAALINTANYQPKPARLKSISSDGMCLVYGSGQHALEMAKLLSTKLSVTLLLSDDEEMVLPTIADVPIYRGDITKAEGSFGSFSLTVDAYASIMPSSRETPIFIMARDGAKTKCSLILDISGKTPLFTGHKHRDGYHRVDPGDPAAALRAVIDLLEMAGEFEKPIYVDYKQDTCAHSRSNITGCTKCLDVCPAGAIHDAGDYVSIDSGICGGCGSCHSVCPTGSISYQYPERADLIGRVQALQEAYSNAGGKQLVLLVHDAEFGDQLIAAIARFGKGLPANVLPLAMHAPTTLGHVEMASMFSCGIAQIIFMTDPRKSDELSGLEAECSLIDSILGGLGFGEEARAKIISEADPDKVEEILWSLTEHNSISEGAFTPVGSKREIARLAFTNLHVQAPAKTDLIPLPANSPYGRLDINIEACTLCMACTSVCPASAVVDTPGEPKLRFVESACVQCGLCVNTCPENALTLVPQLNFSPNAIQPITLYEEEPFDCITCGTPFATKSTIERISTQLAGKHSMFADPERAELIKMCEKCRVEAQANSKDDPFASNARPTVRTTQDYIDAEAKGPKASDFLIDD